MVCVCPDNDPRSHAGYDYAVTKVSGISVNRLSGVGCSGGGGNLRIRPVAPSQELHIKKSREKATPGYYSTAFTNGIKTELTATNAMAVERYKFPRSLSAALWIDFASTFEDVATCHYKRISETCIEGYVQAKNVCGHGRYKLYFSLNTSHPFQLEEQKETTGLPYLWQKGTFGGSPYRIVCVKFRTGELGMCPLGKDGLRRSEIPDR